MSQYYLGSPTSTKPGPPDLVCDAECDREKVFVGAPWGPVDLVGPCFAQNKRNGGPKCPVFFEPAPFWGTNRPPAAKC